MRPSRFYKGWEIRYRANGPVTGQYTAHRWSVRLSARNREELCEMIDLRRPTIKGTNTPR